MFSRHSPRLWSLDLPLIFSERPGAKVANRLVIVRLVLMPVLCLVLGGCFINGPEYQVIYNPNVTNLTGTSATFSATSGVPDINRYFEYRAVDLLPGESSDPITVEPRDEYSSLTMSRTITGLSPGRRYYFQMVHEGRPGGSGSNTETRLDTYTEKMYFTFGMPQVTSPTVVPLTSSSVTLGGTVADEGASPIIERGIVMVRNDQIRAEDGAFEPIFRRAIGREFPDPRVEEGGYFRKILNIGAEGVFSVDVDSLDPGRTYTFRAYATNSYDTAYSEAFVFTAGAPTVTSPAAVDLTPTSAVLGADVTHEGASPITSRGIQVATLKYGFFPTEIGFGVQPSFVVPLPGTTGEFTANITINVTGGRYLGRDLVFRAYATNEFGTTYSEITPLSLPSDLIVLPPTVADVTPITATLGANVVNDYGPPVTGRGILISVIEGRFDPYNSNRNELLYGAPFEIGDPGVTQFPASGTTGAFTLEATGLEPGTLYRVRGYATNENGTEYSNADAFETPGNPVVSEVSVNSVGQSIATLAAEVTSEGASALTGRGMLVAPADLNPTPELGGEGVMQFPAGTGSGSFSVDATGLAANTAYAVAAYATNAVGTVYSGTLEFTTLGVEAGGVDVAFAGTLAGSDPFSMINATAVQPDGKVLLVGRFNQVNGVARSNIARLNADGTLDTGFITSVPSEGSSVAVLPDGKILIGGQFWSTVNGVAQGSLARLNADGTLDTTFVANVQGWIQVLVPQADGKILIGGTIFQLDGASFSSGIARLNEDGSLDTTFAGFTDYGYVSSLAVQPDGKILVSGVFSRLNDDPNYGRFGRFNADGTLDTAFIPGAQPNILLNGSVEVIAVQPDGKILIGGLFSSYQGAENAGLVRLHSNGVLDESFDAGPREADPYIRSLALQADGQIVVGGAFTRFGGKPAKNIVRLNRDGTVNRNFNVGAGPDSFVRSVALQEDGRILVAGEFLNINGQPAGLIARIKNQPATSLLQAVGTTGANWILDGTAPEVAGSVLFEVSTDERVSWTPLGAGVATQGGWNLNGLTLPASGWLRVSGSTPGGLGNGSSGRIRQIEGFPARLPLVTSPSAVIEKNPLRAAISGTVESEGDRPVTERGVVFSPTNTNDTPVLGGVGVNSIVAGTAGAGAFTVVLPNLVEGVYISCRVYAISARGTSYSDVVSVLAPRPPTVSIAGVSSITDTTVSMYADLEADPGAIVLDRGFVYTTLSGADRLAGGADLIRQSVAGTTASFEAPITGLMPSTQYWFAAYVESDLGMVYSLAFSRFTTTAAPPAPAPAGLRAGVPPSAGEGGVSALAASGMVDPDYDPDVDAGSFYVQALATQPDGKTIVAGTFTGIGGDPSSNVVRLNPDGTVDSTFTTGTNGIVYSAVVQDDGKILLAGLFATVNGKSRNGIARLNADGTLESLSTFNPGTGADNLVYAMALQPDGKILIGGLFENYNGAPRNRIARLNADGTLESTSTFNVGTGADDSVFTLGLQADGKILLGGDFLNVNGIGRVRMARLNSNGSLDTTFDPGAGANDKVSCVMAQADGQILVGGYFTTFGGTVAGRLTRLNADGSLESPTTFNPGTGPDHRVYSITLQMDGKILLGGLFQNYDGTPRSRIARLNGDGSLDSTFDPGTGTDGEVDAIALEVDGGILIGGQFTTVDGVSRSDLARYGNDTATSTMNVVDATHLNWIRTGPGPEVSTVVFQLSTNGGTTWSRLGSGVRTGDNWELTGLALPPTGTVRVVGRTTGGFLSASSGLVGATAELSFSAGDIAVEQFGNVLVASGSTINMGDPVLSGSADRTFTVSNTGAGLLAGLQLTLSGVDAAEFSIQAPPAITVGAGGSTQFTLRFTPASHGDKTATLRITSNDPDESPHTMFLTGAAFRDDLGSYAGDEINDNWQTQFFGAPPNPNAAPSFDFDGDGHSNRFEYIAGLNPTSRDSQLSVRLEAVAGQPGHMRVIIRPLVPGRTYTTKSATTLGVPMTALGSSTVSDANGERTVIDTGATGAFRFYSVEISKD